jgi:hypothetical protein
MQDQHLGGIEIVPSLKITDRNCCSRIATTGKGHVFGPVNLLLYRAVTVSATVFALAAMTYP